MFRGLPHMLHGVRGFKSVARAALCWRPQSCPGPQVRWLLPGPWAKPPPVRTASRVGRWEGGTTQARRAVRPFGTAPTDAGGLPWIHPLNSVLSSCRHGLHHARLRHETRRPVLAPPPPTPITADASPTTRSRPTRVAAYGQSAPTSPPSRHPPCRPPPAASPPPMPTPSLPRTPRAHRPPQHPPPPLASPPIHWATRPAHPASRYGCSPLLPTTPRP